MTAAASWRQQHNASIAIPVYTDRPTYCNETIVSYGSLNLSTANRIRFASTAILHKSIHWITNQQEFSLYYALKSTLMELLLSHLSKRYVLIE